MPTSDNSATAYANLAQLTDRYDEIQVRLQELRVLTRALRTLAVSYCKEENVDEPMGRAIVTMTDRASVERNRLYQMSSRLADDMTTLNALIQNGVYNHE